MKRLLAICLIGILLLTGCGGGSDTSNTPDLAAVTVSELEDLFEDNLDCVKNILVLGALPHNATPVRDGHIYPVTNTRYHSYQELQNYLLTIYTAAETTRLLEGGGNPLYLEVDGVLCVDVYRIGGKQYTVDWEDYTLVVDGYDDTVCRFTVTGRKPTTDGQTEPYAVSGTAVYENGRLVLEKILY